MSTVPPPSTSGADVPVGNQHHPAPSDASSAGHVSYDAPRTQQSPGTHPGGAPAQPQNGLGLAALILGIVAFLTSWFPLLGIPVGVVGLILGILGLNKVKKGLATNRGMALAGVILSAIGLLFAIGWIILSAVLYASGSYSS